MKSHTLATKSRNFFQSTRPISDLTTQQNSAMSRFVKGCPQICPKALKCVCIVCSKSWGLMCVRQTAPDSFTSEACSVCVCACIGCLNNPLFSLLILAAAACEAWANDDESKRSTWTPLRSLWLTVRLDLRSRMKQKKKFCDTLTFRNKIQDFVYWVAVKVKILLMA